MFWPSAALAIPACRAILLETMRAILPIFGMLFIALVVFADDSSDDSSIEPHMSLEDRVAQSKLIVIGKQRLGFTSRHINTCVVVEQVLFGSIPTNMTLNVSYKTTRRLIPDIASRKPMDFPKGGSRWVFFLTTQDVKQPPGTNYFTRAVGEYQYAHDGLELATEEVVKQVKELVAKKQK